MKKSRENFKQLFLSVIASVLILVGYLNHNWNKENIVEVSSQERNELNLGDVQLVNASPSIENKTGIVPNNELELENNLNREKKENYFEETRLERDRMYSEMLEVHQKLIDCESTPVTQKSIAAQEISNISNLKNSIMIAENLIKNKGFEDVAILVNNGKVTVIIKASNLNEEQISKIQNIISRELNVNISDISISNK